MVEGEGEMERDKAARKIVEQAFLSLPPQEREAVISHGVAFRLSDLRKRLFLAENKVRLFEEKYDNTLDVIEKIGLPDDAGYETHEDYLMWRHWTIVTEKTKKDIAVLEEIAQHGLYIGESANVGN